MASIVWFCFRTFSFRITISISKAHLTLFPTTRHDCRAIPVCPNPDFLLSHGVCSRTSTAPSLLGCADPDFVLEGGGKHKSATVCTKTVTTAGEPAPQKIIEEVSLPNLVCPAGTDLDPHSGLCTSVEITNDCPHLGGSTKHNKHRMLLDTDILSNAQVQGESEARALGHAPKKIKMVQSPESMSVSIVSQTCERRRVVPPALSCTIGQLIGRECVTARFGDVIAQPPVTSVVTAPPVTSCPLHYVPCGGTKHGNSKKINSECCSVVEEPATLTCPRGFQLATDHCEAFTAPDFVCRDAGFTKHKQGQCMFAESVPALVTYSTEITTTLDFEHHHHK